MLVFYIIILLLSLYGISFIKSGFNQDYISKEQCNAIKGIFILFVFTRHIWPYLSKFGYDFSAPGDSLFMSIDRWLGQLLVVAFLFYSGFGVMESIKRKGEPYIEDMPRKRILNTLLNFDVAVLFFLVIDLILGIKLKLNTTLLAFTGWTSIGNSNWYFFIILVCYFCTWIGFKLGKGWMAYFLLATAYIILFNTKSNPVWYNTIFSFAAGLFYSRFKSQIEPFVHQWYWIVLPACILVFFSVHTQNFAFYGLKDNLTSILFALSIVVVSMKIKVGNKALIWCGTKLFPLYIYQRIPMIFLSKFDGGAFISRHPFAYVWTCFLITIAIAFLYRSLSIPQLERKHP
jgi:peptidoglycan/LPS O-acetylase OafA/YrhL